MARTLLLLTLVLTFLSVPALATDDVKGPPPKKVPAASAKKPVLEGDREIYIPFKDLKDVFEKEGQGVFVPFKEFMKLWKANLDRKPRNEFLKSRYWR